MSNITAIVCGAIASNYRAIWWLDPAGAILISLYIINSWVIICWQQVSCEHTNLLDTSPVFAVDGSCMALLKELMKIGNRCVS